MFTGLGWRGGEKGVARLVFAGRRAGKLESRQGGGDRELIYSEWAIDLRVGIGVVWVDR